MRRAAMSRSRSLALLALVSGSALLLPACSGKGEPVAATTTVTTAPPETSSTTELPLTAGKQVSFYVPEVGDCFDKRKLDPKKPDEIVLKLDCKLPHSYEVFGLVDVPEKEFPGDNILRDHGKEGCPKQFKAYVGAAYETSMYEIGYEAPSGANWGQGIRHTVGCYLYDGGKGASTDPGSIKLEGSVKGAAK